MGRVTLAVFLVLMGAAASSAVTARQSAQTPNAPGMPTQARMVVINGRQEPVPVVLGAGGEMQPVAIVGTPSVVIAGDSLVTARSARQAWDYRSVIVATDEDVALAMAGPGAEGWEAVGMAGGADGSSRVVLLKRPR